MTKQLRKRIMLTMMLLLSITFITIIVAINVWIRANNRAQADDSLRFLMQREIPDFPAELEENVNPEHNKDKIQPPSDIVAPIPENKTFPKSNKAKDLHTEIMTSHFILVQYSTNKEYIRMENSLSDIYSEEEIKSYCEEILAGNQQQGTIGQLRYSVHDNNNSITIAFIDHTIAETSGRNLLTISIVLGIVGLVAFGFLSYFLSGLMVQPVEVAFEKQKQFISDASHELKTPIAVILSNSELLEDQIGESKQISYIKKECDRMHHLVTSLLTLTKLEQTPYETIEKGTFSLSDALLERILPLESIAFEKGITMEEHITPNISFYGVKEQLQQVADILIDNALQHTDNNGNIHISLRKTAHHVIFSVSNTGEAIPETEQALLFERFYRIDKARNRSSGHYGLGLSIANTIVSNHKGKINVECTDGVTSFIVTLKQAEK